MKRNWTDNILYSTTVKQIKKNDFFPISMSYSIKVEIEHFLDEIMTEYLDISELMKFRELFKNLIFICSRLS